MPDRTLNELEKSWWWRMIDHRNPRKGFGRPEIPWYHSDSVVERVAHNYELMRRCPDAKGRYKPFLTIDPDTRTANQLDRETMTVIHSLWASLPEAAYRMAFVPEMEKEHGWTNADKIQWNLKLPPGSLCKEFLKYIETCRAVQKIQPKRHLSGKRNRGVSWREIEILDRNQNHIGTLNAGERHTASAALKKASQFFGEFKRGLSQFLKQPRSPLDAITSLEPPDFSAWLQR